MNREVIITCAVTGAGATTDRSHHVPITPKQIADAAIEAAKAGATVAHCHARDPATGRGSRDVALYKEIVDRIRDSDTDVIINLTAGMGGDLYIGSDDNPLNFTADTDLVGGAERLKHIEALLPEICTMDMGSLNFGSGNLVYISTPDMLRIGLEKVKALGVKPELEIFDTGNLWFAQDCIKQGLIDDPMFQLCTGIPYGAPQTPNLLQAMVNELKNNEYTRDCEWAGFGLGAMQMPMAAQAALLGGHVRVGLEDNLYLKRGVLATNGQLVEQAHTMLECMGANVLTPEAGRARLGIQKPTR